jgi:phosphoenolpyruvate carboxylase
MSIMKGMKAENIDFPMLHPELFLRHRLQVVEELWETVLRQECGQEMVDLLRQLRDLCSPEGPARNDQAAYN